MTETTTYLNGMTLLHSARVLHLRNLKQAGVIPAFITTESILPAFANFVHREDYFSPFTSIPIYVKYRSECPSLLAGKEKKSDLPFIVSCNGAHELQLVSGC